MRRQSEAEQESTTQANKEAENGNNQAGQAASATQLPPRLYPDLPRAPVGVFGQPPDHPYNYQPNQGPTPFTPFGPPQLRPMPMQPMKPMQPRPMSPSERLQSQSFTNGLGRRLLSMVGINPSGGSNETDSPSTEGAQRNAPTPMDETMKALRNHTVLQQLNKGVQSIYGSLSKMYNSTVQQQLDMLQERFKKEAENSTNPWQQRMAQQVPQFFKSVATRVNDAQENLNRVWRQVTQANNGSQMDNSSLQPPNQQSRSSLFNPFDGAFNPYNDADPNQPGQPGNFLHQIGRSFGFNSDPMGPPGRQDGGGDFGSQMRAFWANQVQPQIGMLRGQIARVWRDLTRSGMLVHDPMLVDRNGGNNLAGQPSEGASSGERSSDFIDNILKGLDMNTPDYTLVESRADQQQQAQTDGRSGVGLQMQNRLIGMQRDLNQLWNSLTGSLQNALGNVRQSMNPQLQPPIMEGAASSNRKPQQVDPAENEIDNQITDLTKLQRDADVVHDAVQRQQQVQQRQNFGDRFRNFFNDVDFNVDQIPARFGDSVSRIGNAVGDLWNQIPRRWDNFMQNMRPEPQPNGANARIKASNDTQKP